MLPGSGLVFDFNALGGSCPLQGWGRYQGNPFYLRFRHGHATLQVWRDRGWPVVTYPVHDEDPPRAERVAPPPPYGTSARVNPRRARPFPAQLRDAWAHRYLDGPPRGRSHQLRLEGPKST